MKKQFKITTAIVAASVLAAGIVGGSLLAKTNSTENYIITQQTDISNVAPLSHTDSEILVSPDVVKDGYNLQNIQKRLINDAEFRPEHFKKIFVTKDFDNDTLFTPKDAGSISGDKYTIIIVASSGWVTDVPVNNKEYTVDVTLPSQLDSTITSLNLDKAHFNANNIKSLLFPNNDDNLERTEFDKLFTLENFATPNTITASNPDVQGNTFTMNINATGAYSAGEIIAKDFPLTVNGLDVRNDSTITLNAFSSPDEYNFENIEKKLFPTGTLDDGVFKTLVTLANFTGGETFSATSKIVDDVYTLTVTPSTAWKDGFEKSGITFTLSFIGLKHLPDSVAKGNPLSDADIDGLIETLTVGSEIPADVVNKLMDVSGFPAGTKFTLDAAPEIKNGKAVFKVTPDQFYKDGILVTNTGADKQSFDVSLNYGVQTLNNTTTPNADLAVALGITGAFVGVALLDLLLWFIFKKKTEKEDKKSNA